MKDLLFVLCFTIFLSGCEENNIPKDADNWERNPVNPILKSGINVINSQEAFSVSDPWVLWDEEESTWKMWFAVGWFDGEQFKTGIKYATSINGDDWEVSEGLCLLPSSDPNEWDYTSVETPCVVKLPDNPSERRYLLWYSGGNILTDALGEDYPRFKIGMGYSSNGITFERISAEESPYQKKGLVLKAEDAFPGLPAVENGIVADPSVLWKDDTLKIWFTSIGLTHDDQDVDGGISYATSTDGTTWNCSENNPLQQLKRIPEDFAAQPHVNFNEEKNRYEMWFNADYRNELSSTELNTTLGFWYASSVNGELWEVSRNDGRDFVNKNQFSFEKHGLTVGCAVTIKNQQYHIFYGSLAIDDGSVDNNPWSYIHVINRAKKDIQTDAE